MVRDGESSLDDFYKVSAKLISLTARNDSVQYEPEPNSLLTILDETHDCPMQVLLDIGPIIVGQQSEEIAERNIKICLC